MSENVLLHYSWLPLPGPAPSINPGIAPFSNFFQQYTFIKQKHSKNDAYFYYNSFKIFVSALPFDFFDNPITYFSLFSPVTTFRFVINNTLRESQFYTQSSQQIPNIDVYYLPLNWITSDVTYSDNAGLTRGINNSFYRIFSIGYKVISFCKGFSNPDIYSNPSAPAFLKKNGTIVPAKPAPDGKPLAIDADYINPTHLVDPMNTSQSPLVRSLIIYFVPGAIAQLEEIVVGWLNNLYAGTIPGYLRNEVAVYGRPTFPPPNNVLLNKFQYVQIDSLFVGNSTMPLLGIFPVPSVPTGGPNTIIDTILVAQKPIIGNTQLGWPDNGHATAFYNGMQQVQYTAVLPNTNVDVNGNIISGLKWTYMVTTDVYQAQYQISFRGAKIPPNYGFWTRAGSYPYTFPYGGISPFVNDNSLSYGKWIFIWDTNPMGTDYFWTNPSSAVTHTTFCYDVAPYYPKQLRQNVPQQTFGGPYIYSTDYTDNDNFYTMLSHNFNIIQFDALGFGGGLYNQPDAPNTNAFTYNNNLVGTFAMQPQNIFDDIPLSMAIKILGAGFQTRKYYNIKNTIVASLYLKNLNWTQRGPDALGFTYFDSDIIILDANKFSQCKEVSGELINSTTVAGDYFNDNSVLYMSTLTRNKYNQQIPIYINNDLECKYLFQPLTTLQNFFVTIVFNSFTVPSFANDPVILYFK